MNRAAAMAGPWHRPRVATDPLVASTGRPDRVPARAPASAARCAGRAVMSGHDENLLSRMYRDRFSP